MMMMVCYRFYMYLRNVKLVAIYSDSSIIVKELIFDDIMKYILKIWLLLIHINTTDTFKHKYGKISNTAPIQHWPL